MDITIQSFSGKKYRFIFDPSTTIYDVKKSIEASQNIVFDRIKLLFRGKPLENDKDLLSYEISSGSTIMMALKTAKTTLSVRKNFSETGTFIGANTGIHSNASSVGITSSGESSVITQPIVGMGSVTNSEKNAHEIQLERIARKLQENRESTAAFGSHSDKDADTIQLERIGKKLRENQERTAAFGTNLENQERTADFGTNFEMDAEARQRERIRKKLLENQEKAAAFGSRNEGMESSSTTFHDNTEPSTIKYDEVSMESSSSMPTHHSGNDYLSDVEVSDDETSVKNEFSIGKIHEDHVDKATDPLSGVFLNQKKIEKKISHLSAAESSIYESFISEVSDRRRRSSKLTVDQSVRSSMDSTTSSVFRARLEDRIHRRSLEGRFSFDLNEGISQSNFSTDEFSLNRSGTDKMSVDNGAEITETKSNGSEYDEPKKSFKRTIIIGIILIGVIISLAVFFLRVPEKAPTNAPTLAPTIFIDTSIPINEPLLDLIITNNISKEEDINFTESPQHQALLWLWDQPANKTNIIQQYAIATVFIGLEIPLLLGDNTNFDECKWKYVICDESMTVIGLDLENTKSKGSILSEIGILSNLTILDLSNNRIDGTFPTILGDMKYLEKIDFGGNRLSGTIPDVISRLRSLKLFDINSNNLSGEIPVGIWNLTELETLAVYSNNKIKGVIPKAIGNLKSLVNLDLTFTDLTGTFPTEIGLLSQAKEVLLGDSDYGGTIPTEFGQLSNLETLFFGFTQTNGTFPTELGKLKNLGELHIKGNAIIGKIPTEFGNLENLSYFHVEDEYMTGTIPSEMARLTKLSQVYLCETGLTGTLPETWCLNEDVEIRAELTCSCCKRCRFFGG